MPMIVTGMRLRKAKGEGDTDAAVAALSAHIANGWGPAPGRVARCYADQGYTQKLKFAFEVGKLGYTVCADAKQAPPRTGYQLREGPMLVAGKLVSPGATHLLRHRHLRPVDETTASDDDLRDRQDLIDEIKRYVMPMNGQPIPYPDGSRYKGQVRIRLICPAACGLVECVWRPESHDPTGQTPVVRNPPEEPADCCLTAYSSVRVPASFLKHLDVEIRGSFEHDDAYNLNRSAIEKINGYIQRADIGGFSTDSIQMMGRARVGFALALAVACVNIRVLEATTNRYGTTDCMPKTPRVGLARKRDGRIERSRRTHP